jgi:hypothetical protein
MNRARRGWFFDKAGEDDWGCIWQKTEIDNMGQVRIHPLKDWSQLKDYEPPDPDDSFYYERIPETLDRAGDKYVVLTCHFNLIERLHMLHGFEQTLIDLHRCPEKIEKLLDMITDFKVSMIRNLHRRFGNRVHGLFFTDDWGSQQGTFISRGKFRRYFKPRYEKLVRAVHDGNQHFIFHSCGRITEFIPDFIDLRMDVLNFLQPRILPFEEVGKRFAGKICFLVSADVQSTLPWAPFREIRQEVKDIVEYMATPEGGLIVFSYGDATAMGISRQRTQVMCQAFMKNMKAILSEKKSRQRAS